MWWRGQMTVLFNACKGFHLLLGTMQRFRIWRRRPLLSQQISWIFFGMHNLTSFRVTLHPSKLSKSVHHEISRREALLRAALSVLERPRTCLYILDAILRKRNSLRCLVKYVRLSSDVIISEDKEPRGELLLTSAAEWPRLVSDLMEMVVKTNCVFPEAMYSTLRKRIPVPFRDMNRERSFAHGWDNWALKGYERFATLFWDYPCLRWILYIGSCYFRWIESTWAVV